MKKNKKSLIFNLLIILFEIIGFILTIKNNGKISFEYYTEDSNILALGSSLLFCYYLIRKKDIPRNVQLFKYMTTICMTVTFLVVLFILIPMYKFDFNFFLFKGSLLYHHLICPLLTIISFLFLDKLDDFKRKDTIIALSFTIIYAIILITLNILGIVDGPYPFLMVRKQSIKMSLIWCIIFTSFDYIIALLLSGFKIMNEGGLLHGSVESKWIYKKNKKRK